MRSTSENQIKFISKKLVRSFFIERKLDYLFSLLSADAYYLGSGKNMQAEGRKKVEFFISKAYSTLLPCIMKQDKYTTKRIGWDHWLCEVVCDLRVTEEGRENEQECLHETLLFRRRKNVKADQNGWEPVSYTHLTLPTNREV